MSWKHFGKMLGEFFGVLIDIDGVIADLGKKVEVKLLEVVDTVRERIVSSLLEIFCYTAFLVFFVLAAVDFLSIYMPYYIIYALFGILLLLVGLLISRERNAKDKR